MKFIATLALALLTFSFSAAVEVERDIPHLMWGMQTPQMVVESNGNAWFGMTNPTDDPYNALGQVYLDDGTNETLLFQVEGGVRQGMFLGLTEGYVHAVGVRQLDKVLHTRIDTNTHIPETVDTSILGINNYYPAISVDKTGSKIYFAAMHWTKSFGRVAAYDVNKNQWFSPNEIEYIDRLENEGIYPSIVANRHRLFVNFETQGDVCEDFPGPVCREKVLTFEMSEYGQDTDDVYTTAIQEGENQPMNMGMVEADNGYKYVLISHRSHGTHFDSTPQGSRLIVINGGKNIGRYDVPDHAFSSNLGYWNDKFWVSQYGVISSSQDGKSWKAEHRFDVSPYDRVRVHFPQQNESDTLTILVATASGGNQTIKVMRF